VLGSAGGLSGLSTVATAYIVGGVFHAALVLGFAALAAVLGGGRAAQALAVLLILLSPALNEARAAADGSAGYWAFYVWGLAYLARWSASPAALPLAAWALCALAGLSLSADMALFLAIVPLWLWARPTDARRHWLMRLVPPAACVLVLLVLLAARQALHDGVAAWSLLAQPLEQGSEGWYALERSLGFKLEALRDGFLDRFSQSYDTAALLAALVWVCLAGLLGALTVVYAVLAAYTAPVAGRLMPARVLQAWQVHAALSLALLPVHAATGFAVSPGQAMTAALTLLAPVPLILERWWRNWLDGVAGYRWMLPVVVALVGIVGLQGLDLRTHEVEIQVRMHLPGRAGVVAPAVVALAEDGDGIEPRELEGALEVFAGKIRTDALDMFGGMEIKVNLLGWDVHGLGFGVKAMVAAAIRSGR